MNTDFSLVTKFKPVTHVIFDVDGTLLDTERIYFRTIVGIVAQYEKTLTNELYNDIVGRQLTDAADFIIRTLDLPITIGEFEKKFREISKIEIPGATLMPGAEKLIRHLHSHRIPIALATSSTQEDYEYKIGFHKEVFDLFHHVVCGGTDPEVKHGKPYPDIFLICASRFSDNPDPSVCLVFEDAPNGVQAALAAGMQVVMIPGESVPHNKWKSATLKLNNLEYMVPDAFGLPPFPTQGDHSFKATRSTNISVISEDNAHIVERHTVINESPIEDDNPRDPTQESSR